ncbi:hypothetical protein EJ04DRAFT_437929 [Polyplosphaeria fusca]|uniref:Nucleoporin Nup54 alpha-helical domain-containing protein n=1 Tax=Polyplosphaeria fusca TaxID=682080 RepID=A0A9P4QX12_9PLEO|nr:hypothetical protein EJ04DRAFT_437929 [Polyplosphaeria fusca]
MSSAFNFGGSLGGTERKTGTLFGSTTAPPGGLFAQSQQQQQQQQPQPQQNATSGPSLFGATATTGGNTGGLFNQQQNMGSTVFNNNPPQGQGVFGSSQQQQQQALLQQQQQQQSQQQQTMANSLFGGRLMPAPSLTAQQQQSVLQQREGLPQLRHTAGAPLASGYMAGEKSVIEQIKIIEQKWNPNSPECAFQHYLYNQVKPDEAPFYGPQPHEQAQKWEEALNKKPSAGSIPVLVSGFEAMAARITFQQQAVVILQTRLHEINQSLQLMKNMHEIEISTRIAEAKRKHVVITQRTLALATKVQILRNRGYVMDGAEEELKKKLMELEKKSFDPVLGGRQEEIWARMSGVRERARILQDETERLGKQVDNQQNGEVLSEEDQKSLDKLLKDYDKQLEHLKKSIEDARQEYEEYEKERKPERSTGPR